MSIFYIEAKVGGNKVLYTMDSVSSLTYSLPVNISQYPVEDGSTYSDNISLQGETVAISGIITDVKSVTSGSDLSTKQYIEGLQSVRKRKQLFNIYFAKELPPLKNVFFETLDISQQSGNGTVISGSRSVSSFSISFTVKQLRIAAKAKETTIKASSLPRTQEKTETSGAKTQEDILREALSGQEKGKGTIGFGVELLRK